MNVPIVSALKSSYTFNTKGASNPPRPQNENITFGYSHKLKTMFKKGQLPSVVKGFYGEPINPKTVTIEHLQLASSFKNKTKATTWDNIVLTSANMNQARGAQPLSSVIDFQAMGEYLQQFECYKWGRKYIEGIMKKVSELLAQGK